MSTAVCQKGNKWFSSVLKTVDNVLFWKFTYEDFVSQKTYPQFATIAGAWNSNLGERLGRVSTTRFVFKTTALPRWFVLNGDGVGWGLGRCYWSCNMWDVQRTLTCLKWGWGWLFSHVLLAFLLKITEWNMWNLVKFSNVRLAYLLTFRKWNLLKFSNICLAYLLTFNEGNLLICSNVRLAYLLTFDERTHTCLWQIFCSWCWNIWTAKAYQNKTALEMFSCRVLKTHWHVSPQRNGNFQSWPTRQWTLILKDHQKSHKYHVSFLKPWNMILNIDNPSQGAASDAYLVFLWHVLRVSFVWVLVCILLSMFSVRNSRRLLPGSDFCFDFWNGYRQSKVEVTSVAVTRLEWFEVKVNISAPICHEPGVSWR